MSEDEKRYDFEMKERKRVLEVYNKGETDFDNPEEYDKYLEKIEIMIDKIVGSSPEDRAS